MRPDFLRPGWTNTVTNASNTWILGNPQNNNFNTIDPNSVNSAICPWVAEDQDEWLITPSFGLGNGAASIEFYAAHSTNFLSSATLKLLISTNGGSSWNPIWEAVNDGQDFKWRHVNIDLASYGGNANIKLAWQYVGNDGDLVGLDGIKLVGFQFSTDVKDITENIPTSFDMSQNYPNPFNPNTSFKFSLPQAEDVNIIIYDIVGRKVTEVVNAHQSPGTYEVTWDGRNDFGTSVASGTYLYRIKAGNFVQTKKMTLLK